MANHELWERVNSYQNLRSAWTKVHENKGGPGVDRITLEEFERNLEINLREMQDQLERGDYKPLPVLRIYISKEDGSKRPLGIPVIRDRVVQHALLSVISPLFEKDFLDCSFAYRPGRSALDAIQAIEHLLEEGFKWVLDGDIEKFFDSIDHELLLGFVADTVRDTKVLRVIEAVLSASVFESMTLRDVYEGITQGNVISPLLANVYLHRFDQALISKGYHLIRYADDFVILGESQEQVSKALADTAATLREFKLNLNEKKTKLLPVQEGFVFLGYYIDAKGKGPSKKAIEAISRKLEEITEANKRKNLETQLDDLKQSLRGWSSYFHTCRGIEPTNPLVLIALIDLSVELGDEEHAKRLLSKRTAFDIDQADIYYYTGHLAQVLGQREEALDCFSHALALDPNHSNAKEALKQLDLVDEDIYPSIKRLRKLIHFCPDLSQPYRDLAACYAELGEYGRAQEACQKALTLEADVKHEKERPITVVIPPEPPQQLSFSEEEISRFSSLFHGREGVFARQWVDEKGRRGFSPVYQPLSSEEVSTHLSGKKTLGIYLMNGEDQVSLAVIDVDINQKALLEYAANEEELSKLYTLTHHDACRIASVCDDLELPVLIEDSGYKGRHLWVFFERPIPAKLARLLLKFVIEKAGESSGGLHWEIFPNVDRLRGRGPGPLIKLPLGIHRRTNRRCLFLDRSGNQLPEQMVALTTIGQITKEKVEEILLTYRAKPRMASVKREESPEVQRVLTGCSVLRYLVRKAEETHYLTNAERVTLLYTFGQLGKEGKDYLHKVISNCINYDYEFTESKIRKMKSFPISCPRIREKHEEILQEVDCRCDLKIPLNGYPSPVLHALKVQKTRLPRSADTTSSMQVNAPDTITAKLKRYIELKKQLDGVEKSITRIESEMSRYFEEAGKDSITTEYGILERRQKAGNKYEWIIKI